MIWLLVATVACCGLAWVPLHRAWRTGARPALSAGLLAMAVSAAAYAAAVLGLMRVVSDPAHAHMGVVMPLAALILPAPLLGAGLAGAAFVLSAIWAILTRDPTLRPEAAR